MHERGRRATAAKPKGNKYIFFFQNTATNISKEQRVYRIKTENNPNSRNEETKMKELRKRTRIQPEKPAATTIRNQYMNICIVHMMYELCKLQLRPEKRLLFLFLFTWLVHSLLLFFSFGWRYFLLLLLKYASFSLLSHSFII